MMVDTRITQSLQFSSVRAMCLYTRFSEFIVQWRTQGA